MSRRPDVSGIVHKLREFNVEAAHVFSDAPQDAISFFAECVSRVYGIPMVYLTKEEHSTTLPRCDLLQSEGKFHAKGITTLRLYRYMRTMCEEHDIRPPLALLWLQHPPLEFLISFTHVFVSCLEFSVPQKHTFSQQYQTIDDHRREVEAIKRKIESLRQKGDTARRHKEAAATSCREVIVRTQQTAEAIRELNEEFEGLRKQYENVVDRQEELDRALVDKTHELKMMEEMIVMSRKALTQDPKTMKQLRDRLSNEAEKLEYQYESCNSEFENLERRREAMRRESDVEGEKGKAYEDLIAAIQATKENGTLVIATDKEEVELAAMVDRLASDQEGIYDRSRKQIKGDTEEVRILVQDRDVLEREYEHRKSRFQEEMKTVSQKQTELAKLKSRYNEMKNDLGKLDEKAYLSRKLIHTSLEAFKDAAASLSSHKDSTVHKLEEPIPHPQPSVFENERLNMEALIYRLTQQPGGDTRYDTEWQTALEEEEEENWAPLPGGPLKSRRRHSRRLTSRRAGGV